MDMKRPLRTVCRVDVLLSETKPPEASDLPGVDLYRGPCAATALVHCRLDNPQASSSESDTGGAPKPALSGLFFLYFVGLGHGLAPSL